MNRNLKATFHLPNEAEHARHGPGGREGPEGFLRTGPPGTRRPGRRRSDDDRCPRPRGSSRNRLPRCGPPRSLRDRLEVRLHETEGPEPGRARDEGHGPHRRRPEPRAGRRQEGDGLRHHEGPLVVPTFGRTSILGTNPISLAAPAMNEKAFVLDMATSTVPRGKVEVYNRLGKPMPHGWAVDETGRS